MKTATKQDIQKARDTLDQHVRDVIQGHFSPDTGTPFWLEWADQAGWDPRKEVKSIDDMIQFPHFQDAWLQDVPQEKFIPKGYEGNPYFVFETGGTTGMPKQRLCWEDHLIDYSEFSETLDDPCFPKGGSWLMVGPTGPRRLRLSIEHLAHIRGGVCFFVDLDPRWVKKMISEQQLDQARAYQEHVIDQAVTIIQHRHIECLFTTPRLLESLGDRISIPDSGIKGVFCGGTQMTPQNIRFLIEEVLENRTAFVPTYGNTLMGLACSLPFEPDDHYSVTYYAPQPRAALRVVHPDNTDQEVSYEAWGRVELTTLTKEFFMPRFLERDEAIRRAPSDLYPWDGVGEVRPFGASEKKIIEGVY